ncbi:glycerol kinase GlpK [Quadrisphaera sp. DSM 44207]|uniref:FGGY family carbohydrate kinase n=1 Tax=Quadrisphaera sp. DSM 44207 TaxID=1881057 RepID=UPI00088BA147|nr:glycerol kinase GlpK [Quadrisphaera sp. DSM 44207]SDQ83403.1 glycerol kinase [Quadrisphaera sp. DSM 44207]
MSPRYVMALDEGSTSARTVLVDPEGRIVSEARNPLVPIFPRPGWVEFDPVALWRAQHDSMRQAMAQVGASGADIAAVGITTHRESAMVWDRRTGEPVHNAVMWMSKQTDPLVRRWSAAGLDPVVRERTGVNNDSYFSAGKLAWLVENVPGARERALRGELAAGTVDTWLLWNLTGGRSHLTDHSEASRTALFNLGQLAWDEELCAACDVPLELLAPAVASDSRFGEVDPAVLGGPGGPPVPVTAVLADQQAGMFGQACFTVGSVKNTYGTAGVLTANCGQAPVDLPGLTSSVAWTVQGRTDFEAEGVVFSCGQTLQWLRDRLGVFGPGDDVEALARRAGDSGGVYLVPAFAGLCAPHWDRQARASIVGLTLESGAEHVVRAGLEAMAYQTRDNIDALVRGGVPVPELKVDGGATRNDLLCQFQADISGIPVVRPDQLERTALGVAYLAGAGAGVWRVPDDVEGGWRAERVFEPSMPADRREELYAGWQDAVASVRGRTPVGAAAAP